MALIKHILENRIDNTQKIKEAEAKLKAHQELMSKHSSADFKSKQELSAGFLTWLKDNPRQHNLSPRTKGEADKREATIKRSLKGQASAFDHKDVYHLMERHETTLKENLESLKHRHGVEQMSSGGDIKSVVPGYKKGAVWTGD